MTGNDSGAARGTSDLQTEIRKQLKSRRIQQVEALGLDPNSAKNLIDKEYQGKAALHSPFKQIETQLEGIPPEFWGDVRLDVRPVTGP